MRVSAGSSISTPMTARMLCCTWAATSAFTSTRRIARRRRTKSVVVGMDVGSTTVKAAVLDPETLEILWSDYQRHQTKQPEKVLELLEAIENAFPDSPRESWRMFMTGSGALPLCPPLGAKF